jgi:hypothetical protein
MTFLICLVLFSRLISILLPLGVKEVSLNQGVFVVHIIHEAQSAEVRVRIIDVDSRSTVVPGTCRS